jgi:hypothetical protein
MEVLKPVASRKQAAAGWLSSSRVSTFALRNDVRAISLRYTVLSAFQTFNAWSMSVLRKEMRQQPLTK